MTKKHIVWFEEVDKEDVALVGGKGANLGEMINAGLPIPYGFIITSKSYFDFISYNNLENKIRALLKDLDYENTAELAKRGEKIRTLIKQGDFPPKFLEQLYTFYLDLEIKEKKIFNKLNIIAELTHHFKKLVKHPYVAVRSSATAEDLPTASFAGQQETFLNIAGEHNLAIAVRNCYASLFTNRAIYYRFQKGFDHFKVGIAVVVQRMIQSDVSGIAFSIDPVTNRKDIMVIEAILGLGEYIVSGKVNPDHYEVDKNSFVIVKKQIGNQQVMLKKKGNKNIELKLAKKEKTSQKLADSKILELSLLIKKIEQHYYFPQDIEWAMEKDQLYIVQSRPITTTKTTNKTVNLATNEKPIAIGSPASPGVGFGTAKIILTPAEINKIKPGDVLVAPQTNPDYVPAMKKASAIVTEHGGRTSHAAIVSRELGVPAVVGVKNILKTVKNNQKITVVGDTGEIYNGIIKPKNINNTDKENLKTKTKVYVNLAQPELATEIAKTNADGVGLLRAEFIIADIGIHPKYAIEHNLEEKYIDKLSHGVLKIAQVFYPRPVIYRATDFKTNEYRNLKGGNKYEKIEENPMIGYRGAQRYIADPMEFNLELEMIKRLHKKGFHNLGLMIPFIRAPWELIEIKNMLARKKILQLPEFKLWIMVETPATVLMLEDFIKLGIDGVSVGTNDLTMLTLGVDRDNETISHLYDERSPAVVEFLKTIVRICKKHKITSSICGQAASDFPEIVETLVNEGVTSVSVNPDAVTKTRKMIFELEQKMR
ncbi:MAG: phosphoenolpyruvate synthase [Patescibacteria group bacterium]|nr:MAG: phosphoenolpyruvate synthase [Patescibacteria group bacterium]